LKAKFLIDRNAPYFDGFAVQWMKSPFPCKSNAMHYVAIAMHAIKWHERQSNNAKNLYSRQGSPQTGGT
jgi:hypothetical protein